MTGQYLGRKRPKGAWFPCLAFLMIVGYTSQSTACTVFYAVQGDTILVGNNEDYFNPRTKIWFHPARAGEFGRVYFGWDNEYDLPMGGINDQGLFFDWLAVPPFSVGAAPDKDPLPVACEFVHRMMKTCRTVDEALSLYRQIDMTGRWEAILIVGDAAGNCGLVEGEQVVRKGELDRYFVATNFRQSVVKPEEITCARHQLVTNMLRLGDASLSLFRDALAATHAETPAATVYSNIYDLKKKVVYVYHFHDYDQCYVLDVAKELEKGERTLNLPSLFSPNIASQAFEDERPDPARFVQQALSRDPADYAGSYESEAYRVTVSARGHELSAEPSIGLRYELVPLGNDRFKAFRLGTLSEFEFLNDTTGRVSMLLIRVGGRTIDLRRQISGK